ncbi:TIGR02452 family protein [Histomonas meleagridis]|nr:TIGR02452 family protein [Histomonas meleagridis]
MNKKNINKEIAQETLDVLKVGFYTSPNGQVQNIKDQIEYSIANSVLYDPEYKSQLPQCPNRAGIIQVTQESTFQACYRLIREENRDNVVCLNFAAARNPGGGFLSGAQAQEEMLCRSSALYSTLTVHQEMYNYNRKQSLLYSDYMIYSPRVPVFREDNGKFLNDPYQVSIITSPAVNNCGVFELKNSKEDVHRVMLERCRKIILRAIDHDEHVIVLGAFGCGVFRNKASDVAEYFRFLLVDEGLGKYFDLIVHPIYGSNKLNYSQFEKVYKEIAEFK